MGDKVGEVLASSSGSKGCGQLYKVQLATGYLLHAWGILELILFILFINNLSNGAEVHAQEVQTGEAGGQGCCQTNFNRLYKYAIRNPMKTSTKVNSLNWESKKPRNQYVLGTDQLQLYQLHRRGPGVPAGQHLEHKPGMCLWQRQPVARAALARVLPAS